MQRSLAMLAAAVLAAAATAGSAHAGVLSGACPDGYQVREGLNRDFPHAGMKRAFYVYPPSDNSVPAPVWAPLTGTVESTDANLTVARSGANALMAQKGYLVVGPVRQCAQQDPTMGIAACNGPGSGGWNWTPWNDGRAANPDGERWRNTAGPDSDFLEAAVRCAATKWKLDDRRLFVGGISAGGTMTNRALLFNSDFWAGGLPISGEWYLSADDGSPLSFAATRAAIAAQPRKVFQGRVGPYPLPRRLDPMIVITVWGGEQDLYDCGPPAGLCADYRVSTQAGSNYFASQPNVVHVACKATHGHRWPQVNTQAFNLWALSTMASHPKGSDPRRFRLTPPPEGYDCKVGPFEGLYPEAR
jgi:poly(3-hydroxybutyrate) depolymerase